MILTDLKPIKTKKIYEVIVEQIRTLVTEGQLNPGDRLPSERDLAERLNVSRASVREALSALEMMGLLEIRSGEGTYIKKVNLDSIVAPLSWALSIEMNDIIELLEIRKMIEVYAIALAAERADEEDLDELAKTIGDMRDDLEGGRLGEDADHRFHYSIAKASKNKILLQLMNAISDTMHKTLQVSRIKLYEGQGIPEKLFLEHSLMYDSIHEKNAEKAREVMHDHLKGVEIELLSKHTING